MSSEDSLNDVVNKVAKNLGLKNYKYTRSDLDETIENYLSELVFVTLSGQNEDGELSKDFVVKFAPKNAAIREWSLEVVYSVEIAIYTVLIPHFKRLSNFDISELFPEYLYSDCTQFKEVLAVSNMYSDGFRRHSGNKFLDCDHVIVSLKSLAKFHALSMILRNDMKNTEEWNSLLPNCFDYPAKYTTSLKLSWQDNLGKFSDTKYGHIFSKIDANFDDFITKNTSDAKCLVYAHGDYWKENILYKYEDDKPVKACMLDFQMTRFSSPVQDFLSFVLTSVDYTLRREHYELSLSTYYDCLKETLCDHGLNSEHVYSRNDLNYDLKLVAPYCIIYANLSFSLWLGMEKNAFVKSKNIDEHDENKANVLRYKEIMHNIAEDFIQFGYM